jgi:hypothetical protein
MKTIIYGSLAWLQTPFAWARWEDIDTFSFGGGGYLLQGRRNKISNSAQFKVIPLKQFFITAEPSRIPLETIQSKIGI